MADAILRRRQYVRFFCHRCNIEFEDLLEDYSCPYCATGFIEELGCAPEAPIASTYSDADMSSIDDISNIDSVTNVEDTQRAPPQNAPPVLNDLAFLMSGGRRRNRRTLMDELVLMISGSHGAGGATTAGAPFVFVGAPGDYVLGGEGLDAVVTQLLGQLENSGPPPLTRERIAALPTEAVTEEQAAANTACSICWDNFQLGEQVSRLECEHLYHSACITPWLQLHATCPICRRSLIPEGEARPEPTNALALYLSAITARFLERDRGRNRRHSERRSDRSADERARDRLRDAPRVVFRGAFLRGFAEAIATLASQAVSRQGAPGQQGPQGPPGTQGPPGQQGTGTTPAGATPGQPGQGQGGGSLASLLRGGAVPRVLLRRLNRLPSVTTVRVTAGPLHFSSDSGSTASTASSASASTPGWPSSRSTDPSDSSASTSSLGSGDRDLSQYNMDLDCD